MNVFKTSISLLLFSIMSLIFSSCSTHDEVTAEKLDANTSKVNFTTSSRLQDYNEEYYQNMMSTLRSNIDDILNESKPANINLYDYKVRLLKGELKLPEKSYQRISNVSENLLTYGRNLATTNNVDVNLEDDSELLALGGLFSPGDNINVTFPSDSQVVVNGNTLTWGEVGYCVAAAVGADFIWAIGASTTATWGAASLTRLFAKAASRFLGPVGVAIAVVTFGVCIANELND
jgi:hypothetical protein